MASAAEITKEFSKALKSDTTVMLGLHGVDETRFPLCPLSVGQRE